MIPKKTLFFSGSWIVLLVTGLLCPASAEPVRNGNETALLYSTNTPAARKELQKSVTGKVVTFRYLMVNDIKKNTPAAGAITLTTTEPSSEMKVTLVLTQKLSLELANNLSTGECVAAKGRVKSIGTVTPDNLVVDPAILKHKDRCLPKKGEELLRETDPTAY